MADTFTTYDAIGNREDLATDIYNISPTATPFISAIARNAATAVNHEWQTDALSTPANNAKIEGSDAATTISVATVRLGNLTQISDKVPKVSRTQREVDSAGRSDEMLYQIMKMGKELKNDMEFALLANKAKVTGNEDSTARELAGIESWIADNVSLGAGGTAPTGDGTDARGAGTPRVLSEGLLKGVLADIWDEGGDPDLIMCGSFNKQAMSAFVGGGTSGPAQRTVDGNSKSVTAAIDVYVSDFGSLKVVPARHMVQSSMLVLQSDMFCLSELSTIQSSPLAKNGDYDRELLNVEYTLEAKNAKSSGIIADLTVA
tara:strand:+ start:89 stop:1039 length:951 start_codon:yes stop_codon:yes gene_type:complete